MCGNKILTLGQPGRQQVEKLAMPLTPITGGSVAIMHPPALNGNCLNAEHFKLKKCRHGYMNTSKHTCKKHLM